MIAVKPASGSRAPPPAGVWPAKGMRWLLLRLGVLAAAILIGIVATLIMQGSRPRTPEAAGRLRAAQLGRLPASPEDVEAHGDAAKSVLAPDLARQANAATPFATGPIPPAKPFAFAGSLADRTRASECLATAVLYEAGDDLRGQQAVSQVVLNRVRHPAYPQTVCGAVYQGASRRTGCQFTFTCDGSLARVQSDAAWTRARKTAEAALNGYVDQTVGLATHYHTDWVYPYWSPRLRKLARVGTHLFFAWPGAWGNPEAFRRKYRGGESQVAGLGPAQLPEAQIGTAPFDPALASNTKQPVVVGTRRVPLYGNWLRLSDADTGAFGILAAPGTTAAQLVNAALALCDNPGACSVVAWASEEDVPKHFPASAIERGKIVFAFERDPELPQASVRFDCERFPNRNTKLCL